MEKHKEYREEKEKLFAQEHEKAAGKAQLIWDSAYATPEEAAAASKLKPSLTSGDYQRYLTVKGIKTYGVRFADNPSGFPSIVIPLQNIEGQIRSLQFISMDKSDESFKTFLSGGEKKGNFFVFGTIGEFSHIFVGEGYSTCASVHMASMSPVVMAGDSGNLDPVIANLRKKYPKHQVTIAADDDRENPSNPGKAKAEEAAKKYNCRVVLPKFAADFKLPNGKVPSDFNDLHVHRGLDAVKEQLPQKKTHLHPVNINSFIAKELPPRRLLLAPWLPEKGLTIIYAPRGVGKTHVALGIGYAVACGGVFLKWEAPEPRRVLYIDGEMPAATMKERLIHIVRQFDKEPPSADHFKLITSDLEEDGIRDIGTANGQRDLMEFAEDADLLILDNLSCLVRSGDENEAQSWTLIQEWLLKLRRMGKSVLLVHHSGKTGQQRGTSKREDILDTAIALLHPHDYTPEEGARFEVHFKKNRGFTGDAAAPFQASLITNPNGTQAWKIADLANRDRELAIELFKQGMTATQIANEIKRHRATVWRWLKDEGLL